VEQLKNSSERTDGAGLARGLGWFSLALGATQLAAPRILARTIGIEPGLGVSILMRALGAREIASGIAVLMEPRRPLPLWARVAGDVVDLGLLTLAFRGKRTNTPRLLGAIAAVSGALALDMVAARRIQTRFEEANEPVIYSVTINKSPDKVYEFYRNLAQLPRFMDYLQSVHEVSRTRSHWIAKLPIGGTIAWDAEIVEDTPGRAITWRTVEGSRLQLSGRVTFTRAPGRNATEVRVEMKLGFTGKRPSKLLAKLFAKPQIKGDLRRLKQVMETGEVLYSDATETRKPRPAQPIERVERYPQMFVPNPPTARKGVTP
jgi:uncharacterized membrane protein